MVSFESDYITGAHPEVLKKLIDTNLVQQSGYAMDEYTLSATEKIREACGCPEAQVCFLTGGTQTNAIVIDSMLSDYEGVVSAETGHVSVHEAGAIEHTGRKVLTLPQKDGKINAADLQKLITAFYDDGNHEHMVYPGMVYITHPTELGTLYSLQELKDISSVCRSYDIPLYMDGARLAYGLMSRATDVTLPDIAELCDVFYIGGTKCGALCGEALVFTKNNMPKHFVNFIKKRGALMAKGRLIAAQFDALFTDGLYYNIGRHAIDLAEELKTILHDAGFEFFLETDTNQQFVIVEDSLLEQLKEKVVYSFWEKYDSTHTTIRFVTCWSTTDDDIAELRNALI